MGTLPTIATNGMSEQNDDWDLDHIMSEIDKEMDFPDLPPDASMERQSLRSQRTVSAPFTTPPFTARNETIADLDQLEGIGETIADLDDQKQHNLSDLSQFIDAMEFVPAAFRGNSSGSGSDSLGYIENEMNSTPLHDNQMENRMEIEVSSSTITEERDEMKMEELSLKIKDRNTLDKDDEKENILIKKEKVPLKSNKSNHRLDKDGD